MGEVTDERIGGDGAGRRRFGVAALLAGGVAAMALLAGWIERKPIVAHFVDRALADAHVPATYRIAAIGPFSQRLEDVRIGDPAHPDLVARSVDVGLGYGLSGPAVRSIDADGVRLSARVIDGRLSLGAIDRLLPKTSGNAPVSLPDIAVSLRDTQVALETPAGAIGLVVTGAGRLSDGFRGRVTAAAGRLDLAGCAIASPRADVAIRIVRRRPQVTGPLTTRAIDCKDQGLALGPGRAALDVGFAPSLDHWQGAVGLEGFGGGDAGARFAGLSGRVTVAGDAARMEGRAAVAARQVVASAGRATEAGLAGPWRFVPGKAGFVFAGDVTLRGAALADARRRPLLASTITLAATPVGAVAARAGRALDRLLADADADARVALTAGGPAGTALRIRRLDLRARQGGGFVRIDGGEGFGWQARDQAWRTDGRVVTGGGDLPALAITLHQRDAGEPVSGVATLDPYTAGDARLELAPLRFAIDRGATRFATVATIDGPLGSGRIEGLSLPVAGTIDARGGMRIGAGCVPVSFRALRIAGMALDPSRIALCGIGGAPILAAGAGGTRFGVVANDLALGGRSGAAPLSLVASRAEVSATGLTLAGVTMRLGGEEPRTALDLAGVTGRFDATGLAGAFTGGAGRIGAVPLLFSQAGGDWRLAGGVLALKGGLTVADAAPEPRFHPMESHDVALSLDGGRIAATGTLVEPKSGATVSLIALRHDLATGAGGATLDVPNLAFAPKRLQPEALTPLTLGVIANVAGTVTGKGRIDWDAKGTTSSGDFATTGLDLAAAFGPVSEIAGTIHFTDLLGMVTPPHQAVTIAEINPGVAVSNGIAHYQLVGAQTVKVEDAQWPFAGGDLALDPSVLSFEQAAQRHLTFRVKALDAAAFVQQLAFPNISATGTFDGVLPMIFDQSGGRIEGGELVARPGGGSIAYVGELTNAELGTMGKLAFDALKKIRYGSLRIGLDGRLDGEIISHVSFDGVRQDTGETTMVARMIRNLPFRFNIRIQAPFRGLMGSARAFVDPSILLAGQPAAIQPPAIQPPDSETVR